MFWGKDKYRIFVNILIDIFKVVIIQYIPKKFFKFCYSLGLFKHTKLKMYPYPNFKLNYLKDIDLELESKNLLELSTNLFNTQQFSNHSQILSRKISPRIDNESDNHIKFAKILIPKGWSNPETVGGRTQGPQIEFLRLGLVGCGLKVEIIEVMKNTSETFVDNNEDIFLTNRNDLNFSIIFVWSLTQINPKSKAFDTVREINSTGSFRGKIIGINTASPYSMFFPRFREWSKLLSDIIFYEEKSMYKSELEKIFNVKHMPIIQFSERSTNGLDNILPSVHSSCLLKQNRLSWLIVLKYLCLRLNYKYFIRAISYPLSWVNLHDSYKSINEISAERSKFMFGFIMVHREPDLDCHLIGSFWDYYRLGVIPIVQMQNLTDFATYMTPYLDYFPIVSELDLYLILKISQENPEHFRNLQKRILGRMEVEFNPKNVVHRMLEQFKIKI